MKNNYGFSYVKDNKIVEIDVQDSNFYVGLTLLLDKICHSTTYYDIMEKWGTDGSDLIEEALDFLATYGVYWTDNEDHGYNQVWHEGFQINGIVFITRYSGVAGEYWCHDSICL